MQAQFHAKLVGSVQGLIEAELLVSGHIVDRERHGFIIHRRGADAPADVIRLHRPVRGYLAFRTCAQCPSAALSERDVSKAIDGEGWRRRRRWYKAAAQCGVAGLLPTTDQAIVFQVDAQHTMRSKLGTCRGA